MAGMMHTLLKISLAPSIPASLCNIPMKYNIIIRLRRHSFYKLLESLHRASFTSPLALKHLQDFIYYTYTFYTRKQTLHLFRAGWLEALGNLARYHMNVAAMVTSSQDLSPEELMTAALSNVLASSSSNPSLPPSSAPDPPSNMSKSSSMSKKPAARINNLLSPSVGLAAVKLDVKPERERWRGIARDWYAQGLANMPGTGKLHHHLGLLGWQGITEHLSLR